MAEAPLHARIRTDIEQRIFSGELAPGERIPFESALMAQYDCSRMTVSKALSSLADAGRIQRRKRAGSFVAVRNASMVLDVPDLAHEIAARGQTYRYQPIARSVQCGSRHPDDRLLVGRAGRILVLDGVHHADGQPFGFEHRLVSLDAVPTIETADLDVEAPGSWLLRHVPWTEAENRIDAAAADVEISAHLAVPNGTACLRVERRTWRGAEGITHVRQMFIAGSYGLVARFGAGDPSGEPMRGRAAVHART